MFLFPPCTPAVGQDVVRQVRLIQDTAGVAPLLFLNVSPRYQPITQIRRLELWLTVAILYFAAGFLMLTANYRRLDDLRERRRVGALCSALVIFGIIIAHNVFRRNWTSWFGSAPSTLFSVTMSVGEDVLFLLVPLTLAYCVLTEGTGAARDPSLRTLTLREEKVIKMRFSAESLLRPWLAVVSRKPGSHTKARPGLVVRGPAKQAVVQKS